VLHTSNEWPGAAPAHGTARQTNITKTAHKC
jgi:hypothetical protein